MKREYCIVILLIILMLSACTKPVDMPETEKKTEDIIMEGRINETPKDPSENETAHPSLAEDSPGAKQSQNMIISEMQSEKISFEEAVSIAHVGLKGTYKGRIKGERYYQELFEVKEVLFGVCDEKTVHVFEYYTIDGGVSYVEGETYLLLLEKQNYIFYDYPRYLSYAGFEMNEDRGVYTISGEPIDFGQDTPEDAIRSLRAGISDEQPYDPIVNPAPLIEGKDDVETMVLNSEYVGLVKLEAVNVEETYHNGRVYKASMVERLTEKPMNLYEDGSFLIVLDREKTEAGKVYLCGFNTAGPKSLVYSQATLCGLFAGDDEKALEETRSLINNTAPDINQDTDKDTKE